MDTTSALSQLERLPTPTPTPTPTFLHSPESNTAVHQQPITTTTPTGDIPPPPFMNSVDQLRGFSSALAAFLSRYDDLNNHLNFINSSIDSKLLKHLLHTTQSPLTRLLQTSFDQIIAAVPEVTVLEQNPKIKAGDCQRSHEIASTIFSPNSEETGASKKLEEIDVFNKHAETDTKSEESVSETCYDQTVHNVTCAIVSEQNPNRTVTSCEKSDTRLESLEEIDALKKPEVIDVSMEPEEIDTLKKTEEAIPEDSYDVAEVIVSEQSRNGTAANYEQSHENVIMTESLVEEMDVSMTPEQTDYWNELEETIILNKGKEINRSRKPKETEKPSTKYLVSVLEFMCQDMNAKEMKKHITKHYSEMTNLHNEIAKALKLAKDPAQLVLNCIGRFFVQNSIVYRSHDDQKLERMGAVLILECFVMISSDGIKIAKGDQEYAAEAAFDWKNRMIREGGLRHTEEVDARGLLLLISEFGIQDHVFKIQDVMDLIRATNVKGIATALRRSVFLIPKIPEVINLMVMDDLEFKAIDIVYTLGLEDMCHPRSILTTYLRKKVKDIQNGPHFQMLEAMKQQLSDLKSVKQCLASHNIDPSMLLPDFKINEKIQNLLKEIKDRKLIQKRKSLENPVHQEAKRACPSPKNMPHQQTPVDHYGMNPYNQSTQPNTSYITNYSPSSVYDAPAVPDNIPGAVPNGVAGGFPGSYDRMMHPANVQPYGWHGPGPYDQHYSRHGQTYDSQPYGRSWGRGPPESCPGNPDFSPSGGFPRRQGPSSDVYRFGDRVEKDSRCFRSSGSYVA